MLLGRRALDPLDLRASRFRCSRKSLGSLLCGCLTGIFRMYRRLCRTPLLNRHPCLPRLLHRCLCRPFLPGLFRMWLDLPRSLLRLPGLMDDRGSALCGLLLPRCGPRLGWPL